MDADYNIYDGAHVEDNCTDINKAQFSYNNGVWALGAAFMYNFVSSTLILKHTAAPVFADTCYRRTVIRRGRLALTG